MKPVYHFLFPQNKQETETKEQGSGDSEAALT